MNPSQLRGILQYVPLFRGRTFVIALDAAVVGSNALPQLITDLAVLKSVGIKIVLVYGLSAQIRKLADQFHLTPSDLDGAGPTDATTLQLCEIASGQLGQLLLAELHKRELSAAIINAVHSRRIGIVKGVDHMRTGTIESIQSSVLFQLLADEIIPILPPIGFDREEGILRLNSDIVAAWAAQAINAIKLIFVTAYDGLYIAGRLIRHLSADELQQILSERPDQIHPPEARPKAQFALYACRRGIPRVHIINGLRDAAILAEVFSQEGVGTLISGEDYQRFRKAQLEDFEFIWRLVEPAMAKEELMRREPEELKQKLNDFYILELDKLPVACAALHVYEQEQAGEIACLCVSPSHENQGLGRAMLRFLEEEARRRGLRKVFALSTQAYAYFIQKAGYQLGSPEQLPQARRQVYERSGRRSKVLIKML